MGAKLFWENIFFFGSRIIIMSNDVHKIQNPNLFPTIIAMIRLLAHIFFVFQPQCDWTMTPIIYGVWTS